MLGEVEKHRLVRTNGARPGDAIILTKGIAIEGTAVIAREREDEMVQILGEQTLMRCRNFMYDPGLSVIEEALVASEHASVHAMHDPTEGGLATALHEVARAANVGLRIQAETVPVFPETQRSAITTISIRWSYRFRRVAHHLAGKRCREGFDGPSITRNRSHGDRRGNEQKQRDKAFNRGRSR